MGESWQLNSFEESDILYNVRLRYELNDKSGHSYIILDYIPLFDVLIFEHFVRLKRSSYAFIMLI